MLSCFSRVQLCWTLWTVAYQAPVSMGFSKQEYWSGLPFPLPGESSWPRDWTCVSCIAGGFFTLSCQGSPKARRRIGQRWNWPPNWNGGEFHSSATVTLALLQLRVAEQPIGNTRDAAKEICFWLGGSWCYPELMNCLLNDRFLFPVAPRPNCQSAFRQETDLPLPSK